MTGNFSILYMGHLELFPAVFSGTSMGICNVIARTVTVFAPLVAEIEEPIPEITIVGFAVLGIVCVLFVRKRSTKFY